VDCCWRPEMSLPCEVRDGTGGRQAAKSQRSEHAVDIEKSLFSLSSWFGSRMRWPGPDLAGREAPMLQGVVDR
jgi:hypothetical protein